MAAGRGQHIREYLAKIMLAFQMLARTNGPIQRNRRVAELGLRSARKLAQLLLIRRVAPRAGARAT